MGLSSGVQATDEVQSFDSIQKTTFVPGGGFKARRVVVHGHKQVSTLKQVSTWKRSILGPSVE